MPSGDRFVLRGVDGWNGGDGALAAGVEGVVFDVEGLDALAIEDVFDALLKALEKRAEVIGFASRGSEGHFADVVVELDQVDEDGAEGVQKEVLLVLLKLGMEAVDDLFARGLGANFAFEEVLKVVEAAIEDEAEGVDRLDGFMIIT